MALIGAATPGGEARMWGEPRPWGCGWRACAISASAGRLGFHTQTLPQVSVDAGDAGSSAAIKEFDGAKVLDSDAVPSLHKRFRSRRACEVLCPELCSARLSINK